jgi:hypothetical protein
VFLALVFPFLEEDLPGPAFAPEIENRYSNKAR